METATTTLIEMMIPILQTVFAEAGWAGVAGAVLMFLVRIYRLDVVQRVVARYAAVALWANLKPWVRWLITFGLAFGGALVWKFAAGLGWAAALGAALTMAVSQLATHWGTKKAGQIAATPGPLGELMRGTSLKAPIGKDLQAPVLEVIPAPEPPPRP